MRLSKAEKGLVSHAVYKQLGIVNTLLEQAINESPNDMVLLKTRAEQLKKLSIKLDNQR